jgi:hypothetical protein
VDTPRLDTNTIPSTLHVVLSAQFALQMADGHETNIIFAERMSPRASAFSVETARPAVVVISGRHPAGG